jgi:hypothetical protein
VQERRAIHQANLRSGLLERARREFASAEQTEGVVDGAEAGGVSGIGRTLVVVAQSTGVPTTEPGPIEQLVEDHPMVFGVAVMAIALVLGLGLLYGAQHRNRRIRAMIPTARAHGLEYSGGDIYGTTQVAFPLFRAGDGRLVENVMSRTGANGLDVRVFDYAYYTEQKDEYNRIHKRWEYFNCAMARHNGLWPLIHISRERVVDKIGQTLGLPDIDLESEEFNRRFRVQCEDRRFATALLHPLMMEFLMATEGRLTFETKGRWLLVIAPRLDMPVEMVGLLGVADEFLRRIPNVVWDLYPEGADTERGAATNDGASGLLAKPMDSVAQVMRDEASDWRDPTPGVDYDLDGNPIAAPPEEKPWG